MIVKKIRLNNYRNFNSIQLALGDNLNIFIGDNAQGKTNLLEALFFLSTTRSHRIRDDQDLIMKGQDVSLLECLVVNDSNRKLKIVLNNNGKLLYDGNNKVSRSSEYIGILNAVLFAPSDIELFSSSPKARRKLMDIEIGKISINYMNYLNRYYKLIKDRNHLLKKSNGDSNLLKVLNEQLAHCQNYIIKSRKKFIDKLLVYYQKYYCLLSNSDDVATIKYLASVNKFDDIENEILEKYDKTYKQDLFLKATTTGIHREDLSFYINDVLVNEFASQGQKRMMILSLKLALVDFIREVKKDGPVLLLDDVLSELDLNHQQLLFDLIPDDIQTIITTTHIDSSIRLRNHKIWRINSGNIMEDIYE